MNHDFYHNPRQMVTTIAGAQPAYRSTSSDTRSTSQTGNSNYLTSYQKLNKEGQQQNHNHIVNKTAVEGGFGNNFVGEVIIIIICP